MYLDGRLPMAPSPPRSPKAIRPTVLGHTAHGKLVNFYRPAMSDKNRQYYNDYWETMREWLPNPAVTSRQRKLFAAFVKPEAVVLDVGCGNGDHYGRFLATITPTYYGVDISDIAVEVARSYGICAQQHNLQAPLPFPDEMFDTVICLEVLEHLFTPDFVLGEMRRVLKPGGHIIFSVPNIAHISNRVRAVLGGFSPGGTPETSSRRQWADPHIRFFTVRSLRKFVVEQELRLIQLHGESFALFNTMPILSPLAARVIGWKRLQTWSRPFEFLAERWPSLCASHIFIVAQRNHTTTGD